MPANQSPVTPHHSPVTAHPTSIQNRLSSRAREGASTVKIPSVPGPLTQGEGAPHRYVM